MYKAREKVQYVEFLVDLKVRNRFSEEDIGSEWFKDLVKEMLLALNQHDNTCGLYQEMGNEGMETLLFYSACDDFDKLFEIWTESQEEKDILLKGLFFKELNAYSDCGVKRVVYLEKKYTITKKLNKDEYREYVWDLNKKLLDVEDADPLVSLVECFGENIVLGETKKKIFINILEWKKRYADTVEAKKIIEKFDWRRTLGTHDDNLSCGIRSRVISCLVSVADSRYQELFKDQLPYCDSYIYSEVQEQVIEKLEKGNLDIDYYIRLSKVFDIPFEEILDKKKVRDGVVQAHAKKLFKSRIRGRCWDEAERIMKVFRLNKSYVKKESLKILRSQMVSIWQTPDRWDERCGCYEEGYVASELDQWLVENIMKKFQPDIERVKKIAVDKIVYEYKERRFGTVSEINQFFSFGLKGRKIK